MGTRPDKELHVTLKRKVRRSTAAVGFGLVALAMATTAPGAQASNPATGFADEDGVEVQMLTGPTCTWAVPAEGDDDYRDPPGRDDRENVVCDNEDKDWWHAAPNLAAGPTGELTFRWDTDAQPLKVSHFGGRNDDEQPLPAAIAITAVRSSDDCKNPCTINRTEVNTGGYTYVVEAFWGETSSTKYAVNLEG